MVSEPDCAGSTSHFAISKPHCTVSTPHCVIPKPRCVVSPPLLLRAISALALSVAGACSDSGAPPGTDTIEAASAPLLRVEEEGRIGSWDDPDQSLTRVDQVLIGAGERLYISQPNDHNIRIFDRHGELIAIAGRRGEGTGDIAYLTNMGLRGDTLYVSDFSLGRLSFFTMDGEFLHALNWVTEGFEAREETFRATPPQLLLPDGTGLVRPQSPPPFSFGLRPDPVEDWEVFLRIDRSSQVLDTVLWQSVPPLRTTRISFQGSQGFFRLPDEFDDGPLLEPTLDGRGIVIVRREVPTVGKEAMFGIRIVEIMGDAAVSREFRYEPLPVSETTVRRVAAKGYPLTARMGDTTRPAASTVAEGYREAGFIPATMVPISKVVTTQDGSIWLRREEVPGDSVLWTVLGKDGGLKGQLRLPRRQTVVASMGDLMVATELDSLDVTFLVRYRIRR